MDHDHRGHGGRGETPRADDAEHSTPIAHEHHDSVHVPEAASTRQPTGASESHAGHAAEPMDHAAHDRHEGHSVAMFRDKFWLSLALTIPVVALSHDVQEWLGYSVPSFPGSEYAAAILGTVVFLYGGLVF